MAHFSDEEIENIQASHSRTNGWPAEKPGSILGSRDPTLSHHLEVRIGEEIEASANKQMTSTRDTHVIPEVCFKEHSYKEQSWDSSPLASDSTTSKLPKQDNESQRTN